MDDDTRIVVFRNRLREGVSEAYGPRASEVYELATKMPGFVSAVDYVAEDGERLALIEFDSPEQHRAWRVHEEHRTAQGEGRSRWYSEYRLQVCGVLRESRFVEGKDPQALPPIKKGPQPDVDAEGGCACGAIRYRVKGPTIVCAHCHCTDCRLASGATPVAWLTLARQDFTLLKGTLKVRDSSARATREFCADCGAQLVFRSKEEPETIDVTLASLDDPNVVEPRAHIWTRSKVRWVHLLDELRRFSRGFRDPP